MSEQRSLIKSKKIIIGITFGVVAAIVGLLILLSTLINMDAIGAKIKEAASQAIEGQVDFEQIRLKLLPRPHVVISQGQMAIQDSVHGKWTELSVFPSLRALLVVRLEVSDLKLMRPDFKLRLPISSRYKSEKHVSSKGSSNLPQQIKEGLGALAAVVKNAGVEIVDGRLTVLEQDKAPLEWKNITACFDMTKKRVAVGLTCSFFLSKKSF
jgi:hypothetical protein